MGRRGFILVLAIVAVGAAVVLLQVRRHSPPRAVTLAAPGEGVLYIDVGLLRKAGVFSRAHPVERDPDFENFVRQTGFDFERDLDEVCFTLHAPPAGSRADPYPRFSEVFIGRFDPERATAYFRNLAKQTEQYRGETIYNIPHEGRPVRLTILDEHTAAASNTDSPDAVHAMIDAWHGSTPENLLLAQYYREIPLGSLAWLVVRVASPPGLPPDTTGPALEVPSWLRDVAGGSVVVASLRFLTSLQLRAVAFAPSEADAQRIAQNANSWLAVFRTLEGSVQASGTDPDVKAAFDSFQITENHSRVELSAAIPTGVLKKIAAEPPLPAAAAGAPQQPRNRASEGKGQNPKRKK